jgi:SAM-dependent methyltransferase
MLDIGCGIGIRLAQMRAKGWAVWGVEPNAFAAARAAERAGAPERVIAGPVETAAFAREQFELVTASHVLEHLASPLETLARVRAWLRPHGEFIVWAPNFSSLERRVFGPHWAALDVPRHLQHFSLGSLTVALAKSGFEVVSWRPQFQGSSLGDSVTQATTSLFRRPRRPPATGLTYEAFTALGWLLAGLGSGTAIEVRAVKT